MLPRILEPEVMDSAAEARDYDAMDHAQVNRVFVADFLNLWEGQLPILDLGTGTAQIPIELCRQSDAAIVVGIDLAEHMLALGRENAARAALDTRIRLERQDAKALPYPNASFGAVISNSIIHHIPEPGRVVAEMVRVLRPGGCLFIRDLLRPDDERMLQQIVRTYAGDANAHQQKMFSDSLHAALTLGEVRALAAGVGDDPVEVMQTSDRHWTWRRRGSLPCRS
jgi:ubiquinone/menaquinone biosynthesis C-methylase UbiE